MDGAAGLAAFAAALRAHLALERGGNGFSLHWMFPSLALEAQVFFFFLPVLLPIPLFSLPLDVSLAVARGPGLLS